MLRTAARFPAVLMIAFAVVATGSSTAGPGRALAATDQEAVAEPGQLPVEAITGVDWCSIVRTCPPS